MLFIYPMWDHESQRIGKQQCTPLGYRLHVMAELLGFLGLLLIIAVCVYLGYRHSAGMFVGHLLWLLAIPFGMGLVGEALYWYSWRLAAGKGFRYDPTTRESRWMEDGTVRTFSFEGSRRAVAASAAGCPDKDIVRILRAGKHTQTGLRYVDGVPEETLHRIGKGTLLPDEFPGLSAARNAAREELRQDPSALLYIVSGSRILDTFMNREYQRRKHKNAGLRYAAVSTVAVCGIALCLSLFALQLPSPLAHAIFAGGMTLLYLAALWLCGTRNFDALIIMAIIFVMVAFLSAATTKQRKPHAATKSSTRTSGEIRR